MSKRATAVGEVGPSPDLSNLQYVNGRLMDGIKVDWRKVWKIFHSLKCPKDTYDPSYHQMDIEGLIVSLSPRSYGKTTAWLLVNLILYWMYGSPSVYLRQLDSYVTPTQLNNLFDVVVQNGYIEKITDGAYNNISYYSRRWTLYKNDDEGNVLYKAPEPALYCYGVNECMKLKSSLNLPKCILIIYDEFIDKRYMPSEFEFTMDIVKTIFRDRSVGNVVFLANTIDRTSPWFDEFLVRHEIKVLKAGRPKIITTPLGTTLSLEILELNVTQRKAKSNARFFGFANPKLASITGLSEWAEKSYRHIPSHREIDTNQTETVYSGLYVFYQGELLRLRIVHHPVFGYGVYVEPANMAHDDSIILTLESPAADSRYVYCDGTATGKKLFKTIWNLYAQGKFFYATNTQGELLDSYLTQCGRSVSR